MAGFAEQENVKADDVLDVPLEGVLSHFGVPVTRAGYFSCCSPHHNDRTPSAYIYGNNTFYCWGFGCGHSGDVIDAVMDLTGMSFPEALNWLSEYRGDLPSVKIYRRGASHYDDPTRKVPHKWVDYWHNSLTPEHRQWLYQRGLNDHTINLNKIGWRPDHNSYSIPFWEGEPGRSVIDVVQFRRGPEQQGQKFYGESGYNRPSIINRHLINPEVVIVVIGTLDALLGAQDGLPMISPNGSEQFTDQNRPESRHLANLLSGVKKIFVIPDNTPSEFKGAEALAELLNAEVRYFPNWLDKDYTDWRRNFSPTMFTMEVVKMNSIYVFEGYHNLLEDALVEVGRGNFVGAQSLLNCVGKALLRDNIDKPVVIGGFCHDLQVIINTGMFMRREDYVHGLTNQQWSDLQVELGNNGTADYKLSELLYKYSQMAQHTLSQGAF